jgi:Tfp pilus assembly protein PilE
MTRQRVALINDQTGLSLVEVIMYSTLTAVVLSILAGLLYAGFQTQAVTGDRNNATGAALVVSNSVQTNVRNASAVAVTSRTLTARVADGASGWQCVAWALTDDNRVVYKVASSAINTTDYAGWTVLATGASGGLAGGAAFSGSDTEVSYSFRFASGTTTVPVAGTATATAFGPGSPESCW